MSSAQKTALSLLFAVIAFSAFTVLAFSGLFDYIETNFYDPRVSAGVESRVSNALAVSDAFHMHNKERFRAVLEEASFRNIFRVNQSANDIATRDRVVALLREEINALSGFRFVDLARERLWFSTYDQDIIERTPTTRNYSPLSEVDASIPLRDLALEEGVEFGFRFDPELNQFIYRFLVYDEFEIARGTGIVYLNAHGLRTSLVRAGLLHPGVELLVVDRESVIANAMDTHGPEIRAALGGVAWREMGDRNPIVELGDQAFLVFSAMGDFGRLLWMAPEHEFVMTELMRWTLLGASFVTIFLVAFLLLNLRQDPTVVLSHRVKRFQINLLREYIENKDELDWERWRSEIERRRKDVDKEIKRGIGRLKRGDEEQVDALLNKSWDEIFQVIGGRRERPALESQVDFGRLEKMIERVVAGFQAGQATGSFPPESSGDAPKAASARPRSPIEEEAEELDEVEEAEELDEVEEAEELDEVEEAEELDEVEEAEELDEVEEAEELDEVEEAEELDEVEEAEELDEVEEAEELDEVEEAEELDEVEEAEELDEVEEAEELDDAIEIGTESDPATELHPDVSDELASSTIAEDDVDDLTDLGEAAELEKAAELDGDPSDLMSDIAEAVETGSVNGQDDEAASADEDVSDELEDLQDVDELDELESDELTDSVEIANESGLNLEDDSGNIESSPGVSHVADARDTGKYPTDTIEGGHGTEEDESEELALGEAEDGPAEGTDLKAELVDVREDWELGGDVEPDLISSQADAAAELAPSTSGQDEPPAAVEELDGDLEPIDDDVDEVEEINFFDEADEPEEVEEVESIDDAPEEAELEAVPYDEPAEETEALEEPEELEEPEDIDEDPVELEAIEPSFGLIDYGFSPTRRASPQQSVSGSRNEVDDYPNDDQGELESIHEISDLGVQPPVEDASPTDQLDIAPEDEHDTGEYRDADHREPVPIDNCEVMSARQFYTIVADSGARRTLDVQEEDGVPRIETTGHDDDVETEPEIQELVDSIIHGDVSDESDDSDYGHEAEAGIDSLFSIQDLGFELDSDQSGEQGVRVQRNKRRGRSGLLIGTEGFLYDLHAAGYNNSDSGVVKSLVAFTRIWRAQVGALMMPYEDGLRIQYSLGIPGSEIEGFAIPRDSDFYRKVVSQGDVALLHGPLYEHKGLMQFEGNAEFSTSHTLFVPARFRGLSGYICIGMRHEVSDIRELVKGAQLESIQIKPE